MRLREGANLSQRQLAKAAGISPTSIYLVEKGDQKRFNKGALESVAKVLGTDAEEIRRLVKGAPIPHGMATIHIEPEVAGQFSRMALARGKNETEMLRELMDRAADPAVRGFTRMPGRHDEDEDDDEPVILQTRGGETTALESASPPAPPARAARAPAAAPKRHARKK